MDENMASLSNRDAKNDLAEVEVGEAHRKLREHFGIDQADIDIYTDLNSLNRAKVKQLFGQTPTFNEFLHLNESIRNTKVCVRLSMHRL